MRMKKHQFQFASIILAKHPVGTAAAWAVMLMTKISKAVVAPLTTGVQAGVAARHKADGQVS